jgi:hypothetical protein
MMVKRPLETSEITELQPSFKRAKIEDAENTGQSNRQKIYIFDLSSKCKQLKELMNKSFLKLFIATSPGKHQIKQRTRGSNLQMKRNSWKNVSAMK